MRLSRRVEFHGERLEDVHPAVVIKSVNKGSPKKNTTAADRAGGYGQRIASFYGMSGMKVKNLGISKAFHSDFNAEALLAENGISVSGVLKLMYTVFP